MSQVSGHISFLTPSDGLCTFLGPSVHVCGERTFNQLWQGEEYPTRSEYVSDDYKLVNFLHKVESSFLPIIMH